MSKREAKIAELKALFSSLELDLSYVDSFVEEDVFCNVLPSLTEDDLRSLLPKMGPRKILLKHIGELNAAAGKGSAPAPSASTPTAAESKAEKSDPPPPAPEEEKKKSTKGAATESAKSRT
jgi:hypothetical protein